jgi:lipopolysaccharide export system protein LptA
MLLQHLPPPRLPVALLLALLASGPALAEKGDREKPLNIEADTVDVDDRSKTSVFRGSVVMIQGTMVLKADKVTVREDGKGNQFATALGKPATFRQKRDGVDEYMDGQGLRMEYDSLRQIIELHDNAEVRRGGDWARGQFIEYNSETSTYRVIGDTRPKDASAAPGTGGRVRAVIQPRQQTPQ